MDKKHLNVVCAIVNDGGKILCAQRCRSEKPYISEHWEFPGGQVEQDESPEAALIREIKEEMDWDIYVGKKLCAVDHDYPDFSITLTAYDCMARNKDYKLLEHLDARWLKLDELSTLNWTEADRKLIDAWLRPKHKGIEVRVSQEIETVCPGFVGACLEAQVVNTPFCQPLWDEINAFGENYKLTLTTESLKDMPSIAATRRVYRACGKDPSRYRPASEALIRRMLKGKELYQIDTLVDLINLASIAYGYSIGGFDADKFHGNTLTLGIGREGEPYEGIGRGMINIAGLPVYRDNDGGVGTPTSDNERTKIDINTRHLVVLINGYDGNEQRVAENAEFIQKLLRKYCQSDGGAYYIYR